MFVKAANCGRYSVVFFVDGIETDAVQMVPGEKFSEVKKTAIKQLATRLEACYGRKDHSVAIYGMVHENHTTLEESKVGFPARYKWVVKSEALFSL